MVWVVQDTAIVLGGCIAVQNGLAQEQWQTRGRRSIADDIRRLDVSSTIFLLVQIGEELRNCPAKVTRGNLLLGFLVLRLVRRLVIVHIVRDGLRSLDAGGNTVLSIVGTDLDVVDEVICKINSGWQCV